MTIDYQILGSPGRDNALLVRVDSGQSISRLLFDCGEGCLSELTIAEIQAIDHLFFSHLHMDHVGGFDSFFRCTYCRDARPNVIWGPPETAAILQHRFRGYWWNLHEGLPGTWRVNDVHSDRIESYRFEIAEAFQQRHNEETIDHSGAILDEKEFTVEAIRLDHKGPSLGYLVREKTKTNVDTDKLAELGLRPGPWLKQLKQTDAVSPMIEINGVSHNLEPLRSQLLIGTPGQSIAYLTDFLLDENALERLTKWLSGCETVVCEAQYRHDDLELAQRNFHTTTRLVGEMARQANVSQLVLFHLSDRYTPEAWREMIEECRESFPHAQFPRNWKINR